MLAVDGHTCLPTLSTIFTINSDAILRLKETLVQFINSFLEVFLENHSPGCTDFLLSLLPFRLSHTFRLHNDSKDDDDDG